MVFWGSNFVVQNTKFTLFCVEKANYEKQSMILATSFYDKNWKILTKKTVLFPKFQLIPILRLQVMHDYVHLYCSVDYCVK